MDGPVHHELAFGTVAPTNVLKYKNVAFGNHVRIAAQHGGETLIRRGNSVRRAHKNDRQRFFGVFGRVNLGVQLVAVARGIITSFLSNNSVYAAGFDS